MTPSPAASAARHLVAVALALLTATVTVFLPLMVMATAATAFLSLALGAEMLQKAHGLESGAFHRGFALAFLVLCGAGGWQALVSLGALFARRKDALSPKSDTPPNTGGEASDAPQPPTELPTKKGAAAAKELVTPWASLGWILFLIDYVLVRRDVQGRLDLPDDWVAAAILATMGYAVASVVIAGLRAFVTSGRTLWSQSRQSQFRAGLVAASGFILAIAGGLLLLGFHAALKARVDQDPVVISVHATPVDSSAAEELRLMLKQIAAPNQRLSATSSEPGMGLGPGRTEKFPIGSKLVSDCVDTFLDKTSKRDFVGEWSSNLSGRFGLNLFDARGLVLDTLLSVCSKKADDPDNLSGYFQRALTNAVRSYYKHRSRGQTRQCEFELVYVLSQGEPDEPARDWDLQLNARQAYCRLRQRDQGLIYARIGDNQSFKEIGDEEGMSADTARVAFNRAMERLRQESEKN